MGGLNSSLTEQVWKNTDNTGVLVFLTDFELVGTHAIPSVWKCTNSHNMEIFYGKPYHSQAAGV